MWMCLGYSRLNETERNTIALTIHLGQFYIVENHALQSSSGEQVSIEIKIDQRKNMADLRKAIEEEVYLHVSFFIQMNYKITPKF